jgi:ferredoxin/flavodoxin---NADP+ reductase
MSLIRAPETYERFERVVVCHTVREVAELAYRELIEALPGDEFLGEFTAGKLLYHPSVTREAFASQGRITTQIESGALSAATGLPPLDPARDRVMLCGSEAMNRDCRALLEARGFTEGNANNPATYVVEKAFVTK